MKIEDRMLKRRRETANEYHTPKLGVYHASQIHDIYSGRLKPENFFKPQNFSDATLMIFEIGHMYHEYIQNMYPKEQVEIPFVLDYQDFKIVGRTDLLLEVPCELKTCSTLPKNFYAAHNSQLQCQIAAAEKEHGFVTYIEKNPKRIVTKSFKIPKDEYLFNSIVEKVKEFHDKLVELQKVAVPDETKPNTK